MQIPISSSHDVVDTLLTKLRELFPGFEFYGVWPLDKEGPYFVLNDEGGSRGVENWQYTSIIGVYMYSDSKTTTKSTTAIFRSVVDYLTSQKIVVDIPFIQDIYDFERPAGGPQLSAKATYEASVTYLCNYK